MNWLIKKMNGIKLNFSQVIYAFVAALLFWILTLFLIFRV